MHQSAYEANAFRIFNRIAETKETNHAQFACALGVFFAVSVILYLKWLKKRR